MTAKVEILSENTYLMPSLLPRKKNRKVTQISLAMLTYFTEILTSETISFLETPKYFQEKKRKRISKRKR
jgi:hypothetical protein